MLVENLKNNQLNLLLELELELDEILAVHVLLFHSKKKFFL